MSSKISQPTILIIVGISGDLAKRKLMPALREIAEAGVLPDDFRIIGVTRRDLRLEEVLPSGDQAFLADHLELYKMDLSDEQAYIDLGEHLKSVEAAFGGPSQRLFYLSIPPLASQPVIEQLGNTGLSQVEDTKLLLEKPFGTDLASAQELVDDIKRHFNENQVYRIDHYLAKEMAQNLLIFRGSNSLFKRTWNREFIESIQIIVSETIGIEGRVTFYEQTGALRDLVQSHLLQLAALILMDLPAAENMQAVPEYRLGAVQALHITDPSSQVVRGQYEGYREEVNNPDSTVETYASITMHSNEPRWEGVPVRLIAGKALDVQTTEVRIRYRQEESTEANELILHIQPDEGVEICVWAKQPGYQRELQQVPLAFTYKQHFDDLPDAYERVFVDAMRSDHSLFATSEEVLASWRILEPVQRAWGESGEGLTVYEKGLSWQAVDKKYNQEKS